VDAGRGIRWTPVAVLRWTPVATKVTALKAVYN
jgi:hypothetical protein